MENEFIDPELDDEYCHGPIYDEDIQAELERLGREIINKALWDIEIIIWDSAQSGWNAVERRAWLEARCEEVADRLRYIVGATEDRYQAFMASIKLH